MNTCNFPTKCRVSQSFAGSPENLYGFLPLRTWWWSKDKAHNNNKDEGNTTQARDIVTTRVTIPSCSSLQPEWPSEMPYIKFESLPPAPELSSIISERKISEIKAQNTVVPMKSESLLKTTVSKTEDTFDKALVTRYPVVKLDVEKIEDATAARLATSLLGHVLFLKGQVPL